MEDLMVNGNKLLHQVVAAMIEQGFSKEKGYVSIEAPTGAGKSYALREKICQLVKNMHRGTIPERKIFYVAPQHAMIEKEVYRKICEALEPLGLERKVVYLRNDLKTWLDQAVDQQNPKDGDDSKGKRYKKYNWVEYKLKKLVAQSKQDTKLIENLRVSWKNVRLYVYYHPFNEKFIDYYEYKKALYENGIGPFRKAVIAYLKEHEKEYHTYPNRFDWAEAVFPGLRVPTADLVILTSAKFFFSSIDPLLDTKMSFMNSDYIDGAIVVLDETDAIKRDIRRRLLQQSVEELVDVISIANEIYRYTIRAIIPESFKRAEDIAFMGKSSEPFERILAMAKHMEETYKIHSRFVLLQDSDTPLPKAWQFSAVLNTGMLHLLSTKRTILRWNRTERVVDVSILPDDDAYAAAKKAAETAGDYIDLYSLITEAYQLFRAVLRYAKKMGIALAYMHKKPAVLQHSEEAWQVVQQNSQVQLLPEEIMHAKQVLSMFVNNNREMTEKLMKLSDFSIRTQLSRTETARFLRDGSLFSRGLYRLLITTDQSLYNSAIYRASVPDTPEKLLVYLASKALVIGSSATSNADSVRSNFSLAYLKSQLMENYYSYPDDVLKRQLQRAIELKYRPYMDPEVPNAIHTDVQWMPTNQNPENPDDITWSIQNFRQRLESQKPLSMMQRIEFNRLVGAIQDGTDAYQIGRYFNLFSVLYEFLKQQQLRALIVFGMKLAKPGDSDYNAHIIAQMMDLILNVLGIPQESCRLAVLSAAGLKKSENRHRSRKKQKTDTMEQGTLALEMDMPKDDEELPDGILENLDDDIKKVQKKGIRTIVLTSYATAGIGLNLQYRLPNRKRIWKDFVSLDPEQEGTEVDYDAVYLQDVTQQLVRYTPDDLPQTKNVKLLEGLYFADELYEVGAISYSVYRQMGAYYISGSIGHLPAELNILRVIRILNSVQVIQAAGRLDRTPWRNKKAAIFMAGELANKLDFTEIESHPVSPLLRLAVRALGRGDTETMGQTLTDEVCENERLQFKKRAIDAEQEFSNQFNGAYQLGEVKFIHIYNNAREFILRHPTLTEEELITLQSDERDIVRSWYSWTLHAPLQCYHYTRDAMDMVAEVYLPFGVSSEDMKRTYQASAENAGLPDVLRMPGFTEWMKDHGYAVMWHPGTRLLLPKAFDFYKGRLGEIAVEFALQQIDITLEPVPDAVFERFDYRISGTDIFIDVKNFRRLSPKRLSQLEIEDKTQQKLEEVADCLGLKASDCMVIIMNICHEEDDRIRDDLISTGSITTIPSLLTPDRRGVRKDVQNWLYRMIYLYRSIRRE